MELILWRHADAEDLGPKGDAARNLTKKGRRQAERIAAWLEDRLDDDWTLLSSPAARATQTADALGMDYETRRGLDTSARVEDVLREAGWPDGKRVIVVGHQPTMGEVAAHLLGTSEEVVVRKGAIWWFATRERDGRVETVLRVVMDAEMLEDAAK